MTVIKPRTLGKKIGQRKRKVNERTTTTEKKRKQDWRKTVTIDSIRIISFVEYRYFQCESDI